MGKGVEDNQLYFDIEGGIDYWSHNGGGKASIQLRKVLFCEL